MRRFVPCSRLAGQGRRFVIELAFCSSHPKSQTLTDSLLHLDFPKVAQDLQAVDKSNYRDVRPGDPPTMPVLPVRNGCRVACTAAVRVPSTNKAKYIPVVVDTGAPGALYLSQDTWSLLGVDAVPRARREDPPFALRAQIGGWVGDAFLSEDHGASREHLRGANVLGMGLLGSQHVAKSFTTLLQVATRPHGHRADVWVTDGTGSLRVVPKHFDVASLKKAIKEEGEYAVPARLIIVKDPETKLPMGDKDPLDAGVEYVYELPA